MKGAKRKWLISTLAAAFILLGSFGIGSAVVADNNSNASLSEVAIEEEYVKGTMLTIPEATLMVKGQEREAVADIIFPNGARYRSSTILLDQVGNYRLEYSCYVDNNKYTDSVSFSVYNSLYQVNNSIMAKAEYKTNYTVVEPLDGSTSTFNGLYVDLPSGAEFQFNEVINFNDLKKMDSILDFIILASGTGSVDPTTKVVGNDWEADFDSLYFTFTDIHDSENFIRIRYKNYNSETYRVNHFVRSDVMAGAAFQPMVGYEASKDKVHINANFGCPSVTSFTGIPHGHKLYANDDSIVVVDGLVRDSFTSVSMDYAEKALYTTSFGAQSMISDLDDAKFYTDKWSGFSTGEAYLTITAGDYRAGKTARIFISNINGIDLTNNKLVDTTDPELKIDFGTVDPNNLPEAIQGFTYPVFPATALDAVDGKIKVKTSVYYNYQSTNRSICNIVNGRVAIKNTGLYTIVYETADGSGNAVTKTYTFNAKAGSSPLSASVASGAATNAKVGSTVAIAGVNVANYIHEYNADVEVTYNNDPVEIVDNAFVPNKLGTYTVTFAIEDFVGQKKEISYVVNVSDTGAPVFFEDVVFPKYFISGKTYNFPKLNALDYSGNVNGNTVVAKRYVNNQEITGDTFTPVVTNSGDNVTIKYVANAGTNRETVITKEIPCYVVATNSGLDMTKYFVKNGSLTAVAANNHMTFKTTQNGSGFTFINPMLADQLSMRFNVDSTQNNFTALNVYLTDAEDDSVKIKLAFQKNGDTVKVCLNNSVDKFDLESSFNNEQYIMFLNFNAFVNTITTEHNGSMTLSVPTTLSGEAFDGFPSGKAYVSVEFEGVTGASAIKVRNLCGQPISNATTDNVKPTIGVLGVYDIQYALGSVVTLHDAIAVDVLDPNVTFTMTVKGPGRNNYLKDQRTGLELVDVPVDAYTIKLETYGEYKVTYKAVDTSGKSIPLTLTLKVFDDVPAQITLQGTLPEYAWVGDKITLPQATAADNVDGELTVYIYVEDPTGEVKPVTTFEPKTSGWYVIKYLAFDEAGNVTVHNHKIWVS